MSGVRRSERKRTVRVIEVEESSESDEEAVVEVPVKKQKTTRITSKAVGAAPAAKDSPKSAAKGKGPKALAAKAPAGKLLVPGTVVRDGASKTVWTVGKLLGTGGHGEVYLAERGEGVAVSASQCAFALKVEPISKKTKGASNPLDTERAFYREFGREAQIQAWKKTRKGVHVGMPRLHGFGETPARTGSGTLQFIVIERLGEPLDAIFERCGVFSIKTTAAIAIQVLDALEYVHSGHFVFADIKSQNLMMGVGAQANRVFIADFGIASKYFFSYNKKHVDYVERKGAFDGTIEYACRDAHKGASVSRRGDIESLAYLMVRWVTGSLSWLHERTHDPVFKAKSALVMGGHKKLNLPPFLHQWFDAISRMDYADEPNYKVLRGLLLKAVGGKMDYKYDWSS